MRSIHNILCTALVLVLSPLVYDRAEADPIDLDVDKDEEVINQNGTDCATAVPVANAMAIPGACIEYRIRIRNRGDLDVTDVMISDVLPSNLTFVAFHAATSNFDVGPTESAGIITATANTILAGAPRLEIFIRATVN